jgi:hypothetical protein
MPALSSSWERSVTGERHTYIPGIAITLEVISTVLFVLRLLVRFTQKGGAKPGLDDVFLIAGWVRKPPSINLSFMLTVLKGLGTALTAFIILGKCQSESFALN